ncbi:Ig-like domain-containing protein [Mycolicibacterium wolinskyi]|uniref:Ig-like domain-containing protein n=1 Tax=Mycolicibacterium wolinskyi TaxID=59750 RepID=UPI0039177B42
MTSPLPASIKAFKGATKSLQIAPLDMAVIVGRADQLPAFNRNIEGPSNTPVIPPSMGGVGYITKDTAINVKFDISANNIESAGEGLPTRIIIDKQSISTDFEMRQVGRRQLELQFSGDYSGVTPSANGGIHAPIATVPDNQDYRCILLGKDSYASLPIFFGYVLNRVQVSNVDNQKWSQTNTLLWHPTLTTVADDDELDYLGEFFIFGDGFEALSAEHDTGFAPLTTDWIGILPDDQTLADGATLQLKVEDNHGVDRTAVATYSSGTPATATVSTAGVVTAVDTGTSVITATYAGKTATILITVP